MDLRPEDVFFCGEDFVEDFVAGWGGRPEGVVDCCGGDADVGCVFWAGEDAVVDKEFFAAGDFEGGWDLC